MGGGFHCGRFPTSSQFSLLQLSSAVVSALFSHKTWPPRWRLGVQGWDDYGVGYGGEAPSAGGPHALQTAAGRDEGWGLHSLFTGPPDLSPAGLGTEALLLQLYDSLRWGWPGLTGVEEHWQRLACLLWRGRVMKGAVSRGWKPSCDTGGLRPTFVVWGSGCESSIYWSNLN